MSEKTQSNRPRDLLVVEDNADDLELFLRALRRVQVNVDIEIRAHAIADSTQAAVELNQRRFDAIFLDMDMPPPDGIELARRIRLSGINRETPIIVITGAEDRGLMNRAFEAGASLFLFKPVDRAHLLHLIHITFPEAHKEKNQTRQNQR
jgi:CheY-like chemotaxis protein